MSWWRLCYLGLGLGLLLAVARQVDFAQLGSHLSGFGGVGVLAVLVLYLAAFASDSVSWLLTLVRLPVSLRWCTRLFLVRLAGEAFNSIIPAAGLGGEPVKAVLLKSRYDIGYHESTASLVLTRTVNMMALVAFVAVGFVLMLGHPRIDGGLRLVAAVGAALLAAGTMAFFLAQHWRLTSRAGRRLARAAAGARLATAIGHLVEVENAFSEFYRRHPPRLAAALALALVNWILGVVEIYVAMHLLGAPLSWQDAWIVETATQMVRTATFFIPASIGAQEGAFVVVLTVMTGQPALGAALAAVRRGREIAWIALGLAVTVPLQRALADPPR